MPKTPEERKAYMKAYNDKKKLEKARAIINEAEGNVAVANPSQREDILTALQMGERPTATELGTPMIVVHDAPPAVIDSGDPNDLAPHLESKDSIEKLSAAELASIKDPDKKIPLRGGDYNLVLTVRRISEGSFNGLWELTSLMIKDKQVVEKKVMMDASTKASVLGIAYNLIAYPKF